MRLFTRSLFVAAALAVAVAVVATPAQAVDVYWDEGGTPSNSWNIPENWVGDAIPGDGNAVILDDSVFSMSGAYGLDADFTVDSLTLNSALLTAIDANTGGTTAQTLTLGTSAGIIVGSTSSANIGLGTTAGTGVLTVTMDANMDVDVASAKTLTIGANVGASDNAYSLTKKGAGTLVLSGTNTFADSGTLGVGLIIDAGTVQFAENDDLGHNNADIAFNGGTLKLSGATGDWNPKSGRHFVFGTSTGTINVADAGRTAILDDSDQITMGTTGTLIKTGSGTLRITYRNNNLDGTVRVDEGTLDLRNKGEVIGNTTNRATLIFNGGTVAFNRNTNLSIYPNTKLDADSTVVSNRTEAGEGATHGFNGGTFTAGSHTLNVTGGAEVTSGTAGIYFNGSVVLAGDPTFNVTNPVAAGTAAMLQLKNLSESGGTHGFTQTGDGTIRLSGTNATTGPISYTGTLEFYNANATYSNVISGSGAMLRTGSNNKTNLTGTSPLFTGPLSLLGTDSRGGMNIRGTGGSLGATSSVLVSRATLNVGDPTNGTAENNAASNRLNTAAPLTLGDNNFGGIFGLAKPATTFAVTQDLASLTVDSGLNTIQNVSNGGGTATLTFTDSAGSVYTRNTGGGVTFGSTMTSFTNVPTGTSVSAGASGDAILIGAMLGIDDFVTADGGTIAVPAYVNENDPALWATEDNIYSSSASGTTVAVAVSVNSLKTGNGTVTIGTAGGADSLSIKSGMILARGTLTIDGPGSLTSGNGKDLVIYSTDNNTTINAPITGDIDLTWWGQNGGKNLLLGSTASTFNGTIYAQLGNVYFNPATGTATYTNDITGGGGIGASAAGTVANLTGALSFTGGVTVKNGATLNVSPSGSGSTGEWTVGTAGAAPASATITMQAGDTMVTSGSMYAGGAGTGNGGSPAGHELTVTGGAGSIVDLGGYLFVGYGGGGTGTVNVSGDVTLTSHGGNNHFMLGNGTDTIGYFNLSGGTVSFQYVQHWGQNGGSAIAYQTGGTMGGNLERLGESGTGNSSYTMTGGTAGFQTICVDATAALNVLSGGAATAARGTLTVGNAATAGRTGTLNIAGSGTVTASKVSVATKATSTGVVNLAGGTLATQQIYAGTAGGTSTINLAGGTIKYTNSNTNWMKDFTKANVLHDGVTIDTNGQSGTISQDLTKATGSGVASVTLVSPGSGYTAAPAVSFTGGALVGAGLDAEAVATFDRSTGLVTGIVIVNPGQYSALPTGVELSMQVGALDTWATPATASIGATADNAGGGLAKTGTGTLTLTGDNNTYNGETIVQDGTLSISPTSGTPWLDDDSAVKISLDAVMDLGFTGNDMIAELWLNDVEMDPGTYNKDDVTYGDYFTGDGSLLVVPSGLTGDADENGVVNAADYMALKRHMGTTTGAKLADGDFNTTGTVDYDDLQLLIGNFDAVSGGAPAIPEPATLFVLLAAGLPALLKRRQRRS